MSHRMRSSATVLLALGLWVLAGPGAALGSDEPEPSPPPACETACDGPVEPVPEPITEAAPAPDDADAAAAGETATPATTPAEPAASSNATATAVSRPSAQGGPSTRSRAARARADAAVAVVDDAYQPGSVTVTAGDSVTWTHQGSNPHTVTADDGSFDSGAMASGDSFGHTFQSAGTYSYFCEVHGQSMSGSVTVEAAATEAEPDGGGDTGSSADEADPAAIPDQGLPATGRGSSSWTLMGVGLIVAGLLAWGSARRLHPRRP